MLVRASIRQVASRSVDGAADRLQEKLPDSVVRAASVLPGDLMRVGGSAVVAAEAARSTAVVAKKASVGIKKAGVGAGSAVAKARSMPNRLYELRDIVANEPNFRELQEKYDAPHLLLTEGLPILNNYVAL